MRGRTILISAIAVALLWFGLRHYRSFVACRQRRAAFLARVQNLERDAPERLRMGTKKSEVIRFFAENGLPLTFDGRRAGGVVATTGCAPFGCGSDSAIIGVSLEVDEVGTVQSAPTVNEIFTTCDLEAQQRDRYLRLRKRTLQGARAKLGLPATSDSTQPWGVVMDLRLRGDVLYTVVALSDGSAAAYISRGPDPEGIGQGPYSVGQSPQEAIRKAAKKTVNVAGEFQPQMHKTTTYPLPSRDEEIIFYVLTDDGVYTASAAREDLENNRHPLSKLWNAAEDLGNQFGWY